MKIEHWIKERAHTYLRHGGKTHRRATVKRLINALEDIACYENGVTHPSQIGRAHIHRYYQRKKHLSDKTLRDYQSAFELLWKLLTRKGAPPRPAIQSIKNRAPCAVSIHP